MQQPPRLVLFRSLKSSWSTVVPNNWGNGGSRGWPGAPTWSVAYVIIPAHVMQLGDNISLIHEHYAGIKAHVDFLARQRAYGDGVPQFGLLGDWCSVEPFCPGSSDGCLASPGWTNGDATTAFYFIKSVEDLIKMAKLVGQTADAAKYTQMLAAAKKAYHAVFFNSSSSSYGATQTGNALAIAAGIPPDAAAQAGALAALTANIEARGKHLATGGVGARWLLQALTMSNRTDLAMDLATQTTAPSWYDFVLAGPGTLHESWGSPGRPSIPAKKACTKDCAMVSVTGAGYWSGTGDQPLPGARAATTASACSAACLADASCVQMTWAPAHAVKCSLYTSIQPGKQEHNPQCTASAVKCAKGATDPTVCAAFGGSPGAAASEGGSHNHPMFGGGVDPWIYRTVGGLRPPTAAEAPRLALGVECEVMRRVRGAAVETMIHGHKVRSDWRWDDGSRTLTYHATVPVGFRASLVVPRTCGGGTLARLAEGDDDGAVVWLADGSDVTAIAGVDRAELGDEALTVELASGIFRFTAALPLALDNGATAQELDLVA